MNVARVCAEIIVGTVSTLLVGMALLLLVYFVTHFLQIVSVLIAGLVVVFMLRVAGQAVFVLLGWR